jgi:peptide/nickel transport system permease protein
MTTLRFVRSLAVVFIVVSIVFVMGRKVGDPVTLLAPIDANRADLEKIKDSEGLNDPLIQQYGRFLADAVRLDFGTSYRANQPAFDVVRSRIWATVQLGFSALAVGLIIGIPAGVVAAIKRGSGLDVVARLFALLGQAVPSFWLGLILILIFSVRLDLLPTGGKGDFRNLILPALTLGSFPAAAIMRFTRSAMIDALGQDYVRTARAKGLAGFTVIRRHALRNSLLSVVTLLGLQMGSILSGAIVVETVFAWPGLGRLSIQSITAADFPVVQAAVIMTSIWIVTANLVVDISYSFLDPRIRQAI